MKLTKTTTILLIILGVVAVICGIVIMNALSGDSSSDDAFLTETEGAGNIDEALFMNLASQINDIRFDEAFLNDPRFMSLVDIRVTVIPEEVGRKDPFAGLPGFVQTAE